MIKSFMWDPIVRVTHWSVAFLFLTNYLVTEAGSKVHQWVGYAVLALVVIRLLWGLVARNPANLRQFKPSIPDALAHLKEVINTKHDDHEGHNPAGAIMIWCMWGGLLTLGVTGFMMETDRFWGESWLENLHGVVANLTFTCVCIHITAVFVMKRITKRNYIAAMLWRK